MSVQFLKNNEVFDSEMCMRDLNLLAHAQMLELFIGSQCGGHGRCGADRVVLDAEDRTKVNEPTAIEKHHLSAEELAQGLRLACQCFPNEDNLLLRARVLVG